jgi:hypothetical protein
MSPARKGAAGRRAEIEKDLNDKFHVEWTYHGQISVDEFDIDKSLDNQARLVQLDEELAEQYREAIERGDEFPAVVAWRPGRGANPKLVSIDGNHRLVGHHRADRPIDVYEVARTTKPPTVALMTYALNATHGRPTSELERTTGALYLMDNGASIETAAAAVNLPMRLLRKAVAKAKADQRAVEVGADKREWEGIPASGRNRLLGISTDEGFARAIHLAYVAKLDTDEVSQLTALLNTSRSGIKQTSLVKSETQRYQDRIQDAGGGVLGGVTDRRAMTPKARVGMVLGQVLALPEDLNQLTRGFSDHERTETAGRIMEAVGRLTKLAMTLNPNQT